MMDFGYDVQWLTSSIAGRCGSGVEEKLREKLTQLDHHLYKYYKNVEPIKVILGTIICCLALHKKPHGF